MGLEGDVVWSGYNETKKYEFDLSKEEGGGVDWL